MKAELCREKAWTADDDGLDDVVITGEVEDTRTDKLGRAAKEKGNLERDVII